MNQDAKVPIKMNQLNDRISIHDEIYFLLNKLSLR